MWPDTRLCDLLGIEHPIIQAPMAGTTTPDLAIAVSAAGGLGSHGCAVLSLESLKADLAALAQGTNAPVNLNFFCHEAPRHDARRHAEVLDAMAPHYAAAGIDPPEGLPEAVFHPFGPNHLDAVLAHPPKVISFHFGLPARDVMDRLKAAGCIVLCSATTVAEARWLEDRGVDVIIAQGWEAGGHRGVFLDVARDAQIGLAALVPQIVDAVRVPVIAAGGIADGRGIAAAFALGAAGVQIGTAFITADEAAPAALHARDVAQGTDASTRIIATVSGRPARGHRTDWHDRMDDVAAAEFPLMYHYTRPLQTADAESHRLTLYGQAAALAPDGTAQDRLAWLVEDARRAFRRLSGSATSR